MATVVSREDIESWAEGSEKLRLFRRAIEEMQKVSDTALMDDRGFQWVAGVHGGFGAGPYCEHGTAHFITWHRPYLLDFEIKLRAQILKIAGQQAADDWRLPYWNWSSETTTGIPAAFEVDTYDDEGTSKPNPLKSMPYKVTQPPNPFPNEPMTFRNPGTLDELHRLGRAARAAEDESQFLDYTWRLESPHNGIHMWVRGYMGTFRSSFDPIFWCHHANVDRLFWKWQERWGNASIPDAVRQFTCQPFQFQDNRALAFLDTRAIGYDYARSALTATLAPTESKKKKKKKKTALEAKLPDTLTLSLGELRPGFDRARLYFEGLHHTPNNYEIRVFANKKGAKAKTPLDDANGYLGSLYMFGHGDCPGAPGHCDVRRGPQFSGDIRAPHHLSPYDTFLDITSGLKAINGGGKKKKKKKKKAPAGPAKLSLSFVVIGGDAKQVPNSVIEFDRIAVKVH